MGEFRRGPSRDRDRGPPKVFKAICAECKQECTVPFEPTQGRPVYCKECFAKRRR